MIPTEPIGSLPRPPELIAAVARGGSDDLRLDALYDEAIRDAIARFEATGSPAITDGEQRTYHNCWTYCVHGLANTAPDGFRIPFAAGHTRRMPRLTAGSFRYKRDADSYLCVAQRYARAQLKQAVISPSALTLMYPADGIPGYTRDQFLEDLLAEHETEIRRCLQQGAHKVQIDFTEGRLAMKIDPSGHLLHSFIDLNNLAEEVRDRVLEAAAHIPVAQLGTTDDCGFSPFSDDTSTSCDTAFEKIRARVVGTALAAEYLGER